MPFSTTGSILLIISFLLRRAILLYTTPVMKGFSRKNLDTKVRPQDDFFQYACGGWIKKNPIPKTESRWGTFLVLHERNRKQLHKIVKELASKKSLKQGSNEQMIRDLYLSGMDMRTRNKLGTQPIQSFINKVNEIETHEDAVNTVISLYKKGMSVLFGVYVGQHDKNSEEYITHVVQSGLTLPDRDFYLMKDKRSEDIRKAFLKYMERIFVLRGMSRKEAKENANAVLHIETKLARISMSKVDARDIEKIYHKKSVAELKKNNPSFPWQMFLKEIGLKRVKNIIVYQPYQKWFQKIRTSKKIR